MNVLITGNRGFVGAATQRALEALGHTVIGFDVFDGKDIRQKEALDEAIRGHRPDRILHLTAVARFADADANPVQAFEINCTGTRNVVRASSFHHIPLVHASTGSVYMPLKEKPPITESFPIAGNSIYGCSKVVAEGYVRQSRAPYIILRYGHLYGAEKRGHGLIGGYLDAIEQGRNPKLFGGEQTNDFMYIDDVVKANVLALDAAPDAWGEAYNIGTGVELSARDAGDIVCGVWGYDGPIDVVPQRSVDPDRFVFDVRKAKHKLGFEADFDFRRGLHEMRKHLGLSSSTIERPAVA